MLARRRYGAWVGAAMAVLAVHGPVAAADEYGVLLGFVGWGWGAQLQYRAEGSRWRFGLQGSRGSSTFEDPFTGRPLTRETDVVSGASAYYLYDTNEAGGWYLGTALLRHSVTETSLTFGDSSTASTTDPYFGLGYFGALGKPFYYHLGLLVGPSARLTTRTSTSSTETTGGIDLHLSLGVLF